MRAPRVGRLATSSFVVRKAGGDGGVSRGVDVAGGGGGGDGCILFP